MKKVAMMFVVMFAVGAATNAVAGSQQKPKEIHGLGCVQAGVEMHCLVLRDLGSGVLYDLLVKEPRPAIGEGIEFTGVRHDGPTVCMQGIPVAVASWSRKDSLKCGQPQKQKK